MATLKERVHEFWNAASCGEVYAAGDNIQAQLEGQASARYELEPYLREFAQFQLGEGLDILEVGVGMGADHVEWAKAKPRSLSGIDLTERGIEFTRSRLEMCGLSSSLSVSDAEDLPFQDESFDLVYSWGVLHHSPDTQQTINEVYRVLRPGGSARVMIYHRYSLVGYLLWLRYALLKGRPTTDLDTIYFNHLESPGTKAFTKEQAEAMFGEFSRVHLKVQLCLGDLLEGAVGQRHAGLLLTLAKRLYPRRLVKRFLRGHGLFLLIEAQK